MHAVYHKHALIEMSGFKIESKSKVGESKEGRDREKEGIK